MITRPAHGVEEDKSNKKEEECFERKKKKKRERGEKEGQKAMDVSQSPFFATIPKGRKNKVIEATLRGKQVRRIC